MPRFYTAGRPCSPDYCFCYDPLFGSLCQDRYKPYPEYARSVGGSASAKLPYMNYTDPFWNEARTLFGQPAKGLHYDYNDRLQSWDSKMFTVGQAVAAASKHEFSANWWKAHLQAFTLREISIIHIKGGCNASTGYEYYAIGYTQGDPLPPAEISRIRHIAGRHRRMGRKGRRLPKKLQATSPATTTP